MLVIINTEIIVFPPQSNTEAIVLPGKKLFYSWSFYTGYSHDVQISKIAERYLKS